MNKQQQAQAHKRAYKRKARLNRFNKKIDRLPWKPETRIPLNIDVPEIGDTDWQTAFFNDPSSVDRLVQRADELTGGRFSEVTMGPPDPNKAYIVIDPLDPPFPQRDYLFLLTHAEPDPKLTAEWSKSFTTPQQESNEE